MKYKLSYAETPFEIKYWKYGCPELLKECIKEYIIEMDFVTYEIGKKMQEKGYPHGYNRFGYRPIYSDECTIKYLSDIGAYDDEYYGENIHCPTIDEVLKWLREEQKIAINVDFIPHVWQYQIFDMSFEGRFEPYGKTFYEKYEQAALAGIEHVLDNLI